MYRGPERRGFPFPKKRTRRVSRETTRLFLSSAEEGLFFPNTRESFLLQQRGSPFLPQDERRFSCSFWALGRVPAWASRRVREGWQVKRVRLYFVPVRFRRGRFQPDMAPGDAFSPFYHEHPERPPSHHPSSIHATAPLTCPEACPEASAHVHAFRKSSTPTVYSGLP